MDLQSATDIYDAVRFDSVALLKLHLKKHEGTDINEDISAALPTHGDVLVLNENGQVLSVKHDFYVAQCSVLGAPFISALLLAIFRYKARLCCFNDEEPSLDMIRFLLKHGADTTIKGNNLLILYTRINEKVGFLSSPNGFSALKIANALSCHPDLSEKQRNTLKQLKAMLKSPAKVELKDSYPIAKLFLSEKHSDVTFICSNDGSHLPAHKCILSASSEFFDTFFDGPWGEQHPDGNWTTEYTSEVIKAFLQFVYTGDCSFDEEDVALTQSVMKLAHEWSLPKLFRLAEANCAASVSLDNLPAMMTCAELHGANLLKHKSVKFLGENLTQVVATHPHLTGTLASNYPELWEELSSEMKQEPKRQRRSS